MCVFYIVDSFGSEFRFRTLGDAKAAMKRHGCSQIFWKNPRFDQSRIFAVHPFYVLEYNEFDSDSAEINEGDIPGICIELK